MKIIRAGGRPPFRKFRASVPRDDLRKHGFIAACKPPSIGWCWESSFQQFLDTDWFQWFGLRSDGRWHPYGKPMHLLEKGDSCTPENAGIAETWRSTKTA